MHKVSQVKSAEMFPLIKEILERGGSTRIAVTGMSMYPFLRDGKDNIELSKGSFNEIHRGDIVLIVRNSGKFVLHRVIKKKGDCFYIAGDAQQWIEGPLRPDQLFAVVTAVWRQKKQILCSNLWWKLLSSIWIWMLPFRYFLISNYQHVLQKLHRKSWRPIR